MPKVSEEYKKNRRSQIVETARECFIKHGYQKASMSDIIAATGLSAGAIYNHFSSKDEIILRQPAWTWRPSTASAPNSPGTTCSGA